MSRAREFIEQAEAVALLAFGAVAAAVLALPVLLLRIEQRPPR
jgi:hypothetical protein